VQWIRREYRCRRMSNHTLLGLMSICSSAAASPSIGPSAVSEKEITAGTKHAPHDERVLALQAVAGRSVCTPEEYA
jgi:hypothetical protein